MQLYAVVFQYHTLLVDRSNVEVHVPILSTDIKAAISNGKTAS